VRRWLGYTVGGGVEFAVTNNVSLKGEYLYYDLGRTTVNVPRCWCRCVGAYTSRLTTKVTLCAAVPTSASRPSNQSHSEYCEAR
jgi:opacity protein-like surface antigen